VRCFRCASWTDLRALCQQTADSTDVDEAPLGLDAADGSEDTTSPTLGAIHPCGSTIGAAMAAHQAVRALHRPQELRGKKSQRDLPWACDGASGRWLRPLRPFHPNQRTAAVGVRRLRCRWWRLPSELTHPLPGPLYQCGDREREAGRLRSLTFMMRTSRTSPGLQHIAEGEPRTRLIRDLLQGHEGRPFFGADVRFMAPLGPMGEYRARLPHHQA